MIIVDIIKENDLWVIRNSKGENITTQNTKEYLISFASVLAVSLNRDIKIRVYKYNGDIDVEILPLSISRIINDFSKVYYETSLTDTLIFKRLKV